MKTKVLIAAALLVSGAAFSQEATGKQLGVSTNTQVATNVQVTNGKASAQASASSSAQASANNNKVSKDAFVHTQAAAASETAITAVQQVKTAGVNKVHQTKATIQETGNVVKTQAKSSVQKAGSMVKPVKANAQVQTRVISATKLGIH